jgi:hypothetical protein
MDAIRLHQLVALANGCADERARAYYGQRVLAAAEAWANWGGR